MCVCVCVCVCVCFRAPPCIAYLFRAGSTSKWAVFATCPGLYVLAYNTLSDCVCVCVRVCVCVCAALQSPRPGPAAQVMGVGCVVLAYERSAVPLTLLLGLIDRGDCVWDPEAEAQRVRKAQVRVHTVAPHRPAVSRTLHKVGLHT